MGTKERSDRDGGALDEASSRPGEPDDVDDEAPTPIPDAPASPQTSGPGRVDTVLQEPLTAGPTQSDGRRLKHDPQEVRRRIAMAFSTGELSKFAERWRVFIDREGSVDDGARKLVRALDARDKLSQLVESLRAHKPLIEWPEPSIEVEAEPPMVVARAVEPGPEPGPDRSETEAAPSPGQPIVDPYEVSESVDDPRPGAVVIPTKWLIAAASVAGGLIVGGLILWAASGSEADAPASLAVDASAELARSVAAVRSACKIDEEGDSARDQLTAAFRRCSVPSIRPSRVDIPLPSRPKSVPDPGPIARPRRPPGPVSRKPACLEQCHQIHNQCKKTQCGAEPQSAADYETYQRCLAGCLSQYSRCRLTCR